MRLEGWVGLLTVALVVGCGGATPSDEPPPACFPDRAPALEIGDGEVGFVPATEVELVHGPQGGEHITLGLKLTGFEATAPLSASVEGRVDGERMGSVQVALTTECSLEHEALIAAGVRLIWDSTAEVANRDVEVLARVTNGDGETLEATTTLFVAEGGFDTTH